MVLNSKGMIIKGKINMLNFIKVTKCCSVKNSIKSKRKVIKDGEKIWSHQISKNYILYTPKVNIKKDPIRSRQRCEQTFHQKRMYRW